jgi:hypothetical protein
MKSLQNPYVNVYGSNLLPDFSQWTLHANVKVIESYKLQLDATGASQYSWIEIPIIEGQAYTLSVTHNAKAYMQFENESKGGIGGAQYVTTGSVTAIAPTGAKYLFVAMSNDTTGTFTFTNPMLNLGSTALPFVPRNDSPVYFQTTLCSDPLQTIQDTLTPINGGFVKTSRIKVMDLDGSLSLAFSADYTGYKEVKITSFDTTYNAVRSTDKVVKYDGKILANGSTSTGADRSDLWSSNGTFYISIADTDSGWGETYTPTVAEIQAMAWGWKMYTDGSGRTSTYNGTGTKAWIAYDEILDQSTATTTTYTCPTYQAPKVNGKATLMKLMFQLAQPTQETIVTDGLYPVLQAGANQVELGESVQIRERANPVLNAGNYHINNATLSSSLLKYKDDRILAIYKNGQIDSKWKFSTTDGYGAYKAYITQADYDPTASYSVTYIAQPYAVSSSILSLDGSYESNLRKDVDKNTQNISDLAEKVTALEISKANRNQPNWIAPTLLNGSANVSGTTAGY